MGRVLLWLSWIFGALFFVALAILAASQFGLFGARRDPLAGIFLIPLGLPWTFLLGWLPPRLETYATILAPFINLALLRWGAARLGAR